MLAGCAKTEPTKPAASPSEAAPEPKAAVHDHGDGKGPHRHGADSHDVAITEADVTKPADFKDAIARIKAYRDAIKRDTATDTPGLAHRPLDELDFVLKWLPRIARDSGVPKAEWETINTSAQRLRQLFEKVHGNIDERQPPGFASIKEAVNGEIANLEKAAAVPAAKP